MPEPRGDAEKSKSRFSLRRLLSNPIGGLLGDNDTAASPRIDRRIVTEPERQEPPTAPETVGSDPPVPTAVFEHVHEGNAAVSEPARAEAPAAPAPALEQAYADNAEASERVKTEPPASPASAAEPVQDDGAREQLIAWAAAAQQQRDWPEAISRWAIVRDRFPNEWICYSEAAAALREQGALDDARALLSSAEQRFPAHTGWLHDMARIAERNADWGQAEQHWRGFLAIDPHTWWAHAGFANALNEQGRIDEAEAVLRAAQETLPQELGPFVEYARLAEARRDWPEALSRWQRVQTRFPDEWAGYAGLAAALRELGRTDEVEAVLLGAVERFPELGSPHADLAHFAAARGQWREAEDRWRRFIAIEPGFWWAYTGLAGALREQGLLNQAERVLESAQVHLPEELALFVEYAQLATARRDWDVVLQRWTGVIERFPDQWLGYAGAANALRELLRYDQAEAVLDDGRTRCPQEPALFFEYARQSEARGDRHAALQRWQEANAKFPDNPETFAHVAACLAELGRYDEADATLAEASQRFPNDSEIVRACAINAARRNDAGGAVELLAAAVERNKSDIWLALQWVDTLRELQRTSEARAAVHIVMERFPCVLEVVRQAIWIALQAGDMNDAVATWQSAAGDPRFPKDQSLALAYLLLFEGARDQNAVTLLRHLVSEPDTGQRYWRPQLLGILRPEGRRQDLADIIVDLVRTLPSDEITPPIRDIARSMLVFEVSDADIIRFFDDYLARDRLGIVACLFSHNDHADSDGYTARVRRLYEDYVQKRLLRPNWMNDANAEEVVALLQFAAVMSHPTYHQLVRAARARVDVGALAARNELQSAQGILGSILALAAGNAPATSRLARKLRIALCISGSLRGYQHAYPSWAALGLDQHDTTIFVDVWSNVGLNWRRVWDFLAVVQGQPQAAGVREALGGGGGLNLIHSRYPSLAAAIDAVVAPSSNVTVHELREFYGTPYVTVDDNTAAPFGGKGNQWQMHYKMAGAMRAAQESGKQFDLVIRARPDREIKDAEGFDPGHLRAVSAAENMLFVLDFPNVVSRGEFLLGDQFAIGIPTVIQAYCSVLPDLEAAAKLGRMPRDVDLRLTEHFVLFLMMFYRGILARVIPRVRFGSFVNPPIIPVKQIHDLLVGDLHGREQDEFDAKFLYACEYALRDATADA